MRMKAILTSSQGGSVKENGKRYPAPLFTYNGLTDRIKESWVENARVLIISASPNDYERNDGILYCLREAYPMSGLSISSMEICDRRNEEIAEKIPEMDVLLLSGGHVPTENEFFKKLGLKEKLKDWNGLIVAWSAGSMNCADIVYAGPEEEGEAVDPDFKRWITGLGITKINILPHFQDLRDEWLDGMRLIEDITFADSYGHEIIALNDGSFITVMDGVETLYGEAYRILDGKMEQICKHGESVVLKPKK